MNIQAMQAAAARLLTDPEFRHKFYTARSLGFEALDLGKQEIEILRQIDARKLAIASEGYNGKRLDRVISCFARTLQAIEALDPGAPTEYLATTPFPRDDTAERTMFLQYIHENQGGWKQDMQMCLQDLALLEHALYEAPRPIGPPAYRWRPDILRPRISRYAVRFQTRGDIRPIWEHPGQPPRSYPCKPMEFVAIRHGARTALDDLSTEKAKLLDACDGHCTAAELDSRFGPDAMTMVETWLRTRIVEDAASMQPRQIEQRPGGRE